jgi:hypothetical protein
MKYVIVDNVFPIIFSDGMKHSDFIHRGEITSAGMIKISGDEVHCYGESVSLKLKPDVTDELRIKTMLERF